MQWIEVKQKNKHFKELSVDLTLQTTLPTFTKSQHKLYFA